VAHYLVTGGCGFIGAHLVKSLLAGGDDVTVLDNLSTGSRDAIPSSVPLITCNAADGKQMRTAFAGIDGCFHLAGDPSVPRCLEDYLGAHLTNQTGTVAVLDAAARAGAAGGKAVPVVYASSCAVYGMPEKAPLNEDAATVPLSGYGVDKLAGEAHARVTADLLGVHSVGLRYFNVFGPGQSPTSPYAGVISIFAGRLKRGDPLTIHGDGSQVRDFIYVGDVINRTLQAMDFAIKHRDTKAQAHILNVCTGYPTSVLDAANTLAKLLDVNPNITFEAFRAGDVPVSLGDPSRAEQILGTMTPTSLSDGLAATIDAL
tara:strand:+ start:81886 stop:82833 length:948 start_codon:yes stop_codon:yes gene_type:complete